MEDGGCAFGSTKMKYHFRIKDFLFNRSASGSFTQFPNQTHPQLR